MNLTGARKVLNREFQRRRILATTTLEQAITPPTLESLLDADWPEDEAREWLEEWDPEEERRRWQERRDICTALNTAIAALRTLEELYVGLEQPNFEYQPPEDLGEIIAGLVKSVEESES